MLLTGAGGAAAIGVTRCLRRAGYATVGVDCDPYSLERAEADTHHLVPRCDDPGYVAALNAIIRAEGVDMIHAQNDSEVWMLGAQRTELAAVAFLPRQGVIEICQNKWLTYLVWRDAGLTVPDTRLARSGADLRRLPDGEIWLRPLRGAGGRGALRTADRRLALAWLDQQQGWGRYTVAAALTSRSTTWMSLWHQGSLVVAQGRERLSWAGHSPTGVTGSTGVGMTVTDPDLDRIAEAAIRAVDATPHGLYGVDLTYDQAGVPNPTEINIGRCFTTIEFFMRAGLNLPDAYVRYGLDLPREARAAIYNPLPAGLLWVRGMDAPPRLVTSGRVASLRERMPMGQREPACV